MDNRADANGSDVNLKPSVGAETYNKVHHDLDVAASHRKPIVTESNYKVKVAEPGVETLDHVDRKSEKTTVTKTTTEKGKQESQFIAKPDVYGEKSRGGPKEEKSDGEFPWLPVLGGVAAVAGAIAGAMMYRKRNPDVDVKLRRSVEDADHRVKGAIGSGERRVKEFIGSGQQKLNSLIHRGEHDDVSDEEDLDGYDNRDGHGHNTLSVFDAGDYQVKQGDNLTKIARKSGKKSWHEIADKNPSLRNPDLIYPGDRLKL